ncbi:MAG: transketolase [Proteobacteria bacterium]|nr:transketolase [Pseudomonadota bacterium]
MANAIRALAMDAVEKARSGHPGMPLGMADAATVLFTRHLKFDAADPGWPDRDRFVLSAGHGSMLLYALLYLLGFDDMTMAEIERFRQLGSRTAGHPEYGAARGIETTTGPLGQGFANAVGMALAERMLEARFGPEIVDHNTYAIVGDGCLMEGLSHEAASFAGHLRLAKLIVLFDDNGISIDGPTSLTVSDDPLARFKAYGWDIAQVDGHDPEAVDAAIEAAKSSPAPSLIACRTIIGFGAPTKAGTAATHGAPLGAEEVAGAREALGWPHPPFVVPDEILSPWRAAGARGAAGRHDWRRRLEALDADEGAAFARIQAGELPAGFADAVAACKQKMASAGAPMATRKASQEVLEILTAEIPEMIGGSADLTGSNNTKTKVEAVITPEDFSGRYIHYGVREHAMAAMMNGMALHKGLIPYGGTFLVFTDYCRPAIRLSALMGLGVIYVMTHDSIGLGEDGPTHQPVEHLASLRAMPNLMVFRPADAVETAECWALALENRASPSVLSLTRQNLEPARIEAGEENLCARGAYVLAPADLEAGGRLVTLLATGSEVAIALGAREILRADGIDASVVSMPCWELFEAQTEEYRARVLGAGAVRVAVEAASPLGWDRYTGPGGAMVGMGGFGASAPAADLYAHFGITAEAVAEAARKCLKAGSGAG